MASVQAEADAVVEAFEAPETSEDTADAFAVPNIWRRQPGVLGALLKRSKERDALIPE